MSRKRGPEGHSIPPHDFCMACKRGDATRAIMVRGDQEWLARIFALATGHELEAAEEIAEAAWAVLPESGALRGFKAFPMRLCRACAKTAVERIVASGLHAPEVYSHARLDRGEYAIIQGADQPKMVKLADQAINEIVCTEEMHAAHADKGYTFRRWWDEDKQSWGLFYAAYPLEDDEIEVQIGEPLFPPPKLPGE